MRPGDEITATLAAIVRLCVESPDVSAELAGMGGGEPLEHVYADRVPPRDAPPPWLVLVPSETRDTLRMGAGERFMAKVPVAVKLITVGESTLAGGRLLQAVYAAIQGNQNLRLEVPELGDAVTVLTAHRTGTFRYPERADGVEYRHSGAYFDVIVQ